MTTKKENSETELEEEPSYRKKKDDFGNVCREDSMFEIVNSKQADKKDAEKLNACTSTLNVLTKIGKIKEEKGKSE